MTALVLDIIIVIDRGREAKRPLSSLFSSSPPLSPNINRPRDKRRPGTLLYRVERLPFYLIFFFLFFFPFLFPQSHASTDGKYLSRIAFGFDFIKRNCCHHITLFRRDAFNRPSLPSPKSLSFQFPPIFLSAGKLVEEERKNSRRQAFALFARSLGNFEWAAILNDIRMIRRVERAGNGSKPRGCLLRHCMQMKKAGRQ